MVHTIYLGLGTNVGDRKRHLQEAVDSFFPHINCLQLSSIYETKPVGYTEQTEFLNQVVLAETKLAPLPLLNQLKYIETKMGRQPTFRFGPRAIDLDILFYDDLVMETPRLTIPHPRLQERSFVLIPLAEIAPQFIHPVLKKRIIDLAGEVSRTGVRFYAQPSG
jgi:2-amino-4-hydroxy-6-hydroxymethyldihydropteridine diphosphokinase